MIKDLISLPVPVSLLGGQGGCVYPTPQSTSELGAPGSLQTLLEVGEPLGRQLWLWASFHLGEDTGGITGGDVGT